MNNIGNTINEKEKIIGYAFKDKKLLERAFVHSSYANEHGIESYDRLEFLGDGVLGLVIAERLYSFGDDEGDMTEKRSRIVSKEPLLRAVERLELERFMLFGAGEKRQSHAHRKVVSDLFESIVGAIYLDGGYAAAEEFIVRELRDTIDAVRTSKASGNAKGDLQEYCQSREELKGLKIGYETVERSGSDHDPRFRVRVSLGGEALAEEIGSSKREAERKAAKSALKILCERGQ